MKNTPKVSGLKILIAEDDEVSAMLLTIILKEYHEEILRAKTGVEAVDICRMNPDIDLILMDIQMPNLNGDDAARQIREFNKEVIIIAQTGLALTSEIKPLIDAGCNSFLSKPINKVELLALIAVYFSK
ncbi:MAG: CheY-like chemotaxis protein [Psychroserpens sp.]|jgi:CheY-like chemotaxis protein